MSLLCVSIPYPDMTGSPNQAASSTTNPTSQPDSTSTGQADQYKSMVESSTREEARRRFQVSDQLMVSTCDEHQRKSSSVGSESREFESHPGLKTTRVQN